MKDHESQRFQYQIGKHQRRDGYFDGLPISVPRGDRQAFSFESDHRQQHSQRPARLRITFSKASPHKQNGKKSRRFRLFGFGGHADIPH